MDPIELIHHEKFLNCNKECTAEICDDQITSPVSPHKDDVYGNPLILPRLGDQYQVQIPPVVTEYKHDQLQDRLRGRPIKSNDILGVDHSSPNGLAIPIMWVSYGGADVKQEQQEHPGTASCRKRAGPVELLYNVDSAIDPKCSIKSGFPPDSSNIYSTVPHGTKPEHLDKCLEHGKEPFRSTSQETCIGLCWPGKDCNPVPDLPFISWTDADGQSFLLGLTR